MKIKFTKNITFLIIFILCKFLYVPIAIAEERIQDLQQRANFAYEQMMKAKYKAEILVMETTDAEKALLRAKESFERAEQEAEAARNRSEAANLSLKKAQQRWSQASDALADEWKKSQKN